MAYWHIGRKTKWLAIEVDEDTIHSIGEAREVVLLFQHVGVLLHLIHSGQVEHLGPQGVVHCPGKLHNCPTHGCLVHAPNETPHPLVVCTVHPP